MNKIIDYKKRRWNARSETRLTWPKRTPQVCIQGVRIDNHTMNEAIDWIAADKGQKMAACFINVNSVNLSQDNIAYQHALLASDKCFADGSGVRIAAAAKGVKLKANVNGTDLLPLLCERLSEEGQSIFLLGAAPEVNQSAAEKLAATYPNLKIAGFHHGYFSNAENKSLVEEINNSGADVCLVALGSPRQELWMQENKHRLNCRRLLAVGGLFDFVSGRIPRAPLWMRRLGVEWIWRLIQEPVGKFHRYVIGNPLFLYRVYAGSHS